MYDLFYPISDLFGRGHSGSFGTLVLNSEDEKIHLLAEMHAVIH